MPDPGWAKQSIFNIELVNILYPIHAFEPHNYTGRACIHASILIQDEHAFMHSSLIIIHGEHTACIPASLLYRASMRSNFMLIQREHAFKPHNYTGRACIHALILIQNEHTVINIQGGHVFMHSSLIIIRGEHAFMH